MWLEATLNQSFRWTSLVWWEPHRKPGLCGSGTQRSRSATAIRQQTGSDHSAIWKSNGPFWPRLLTCLISSRVVRSATGSKPPARSALRTVVRVVYDSSRRPSAASGRRTTEANRRTLAPNATVCSGVLRCARETGDNLATIARRGPVLLLVVDRDAVGGLSLRIGARAGNGQRLPIARDHNRLGRGSALINCISGLGR